MSAHVSLSAPCQRWRITVRRQRYNGAVASRRKLAMPRILVLHGPNLNLLGRREPEVYGTTTLEEINHRLRQHATEHHVDLEILQTNHEGGLVDAIQGAM